MRQFVLSPAQAMHARLQMFGAFNIPGSQDLGTFYDKDEGQITVKTGKLTELAAFAAKPFTIGDAKKLGTQYKEAAEAASLGDYALQRALNARRTATVDNYIRATGNWSGLFFAEESLGHDERPEFIHTSQNEVGVTYVAEGGKTHTLQAVKPQKETYPDLNIYNSEEVEYPVWDVYNGDVATAAQRTFDIAYDLRAQIEADAKVLIDGAIGTFNTGSDQVDKTFVPNSHIISGQLPTTNALVTANAGAATPINLEVMRAVEGYCAQWADVFPDGPLSPTGMIIVPNTAAADMLDVIDPTSAVSNPVADTLLQNYLQFNYGGRNWILVPDATLATKKCYPVLSKPFGVKFTKPSMDAEFVLPESAVERQRRNKESRSQRKVVGMVYAEPSRVNVCRVAYQTG